MQVEALERSNILFSGDNHLTKKHLNIKKKKTKYQPLSHREDTSNVNLCSEVTSSEQITNIF